LRAGQHARVWTLLAFGPEKRAINAHRIERLRLQLWRDSKGFMSAATTIHQPGMGTPVFMKIGLAIVACLAVLMGVALAVVFSQISDARVEMGLMRTALSAVNDRLGTIEKSVDDARAALNKMTLNEQRPVSVTPDVVAVTQHEAKIIREFLDVPPKNATPAAKMALWIRVPPQATKPLPEPLVSRLEKLRGLRYVVDSNNAIALIEASASIVIAVI